MQPNLITWTDQPFPFYTLITYSISESLGVCKMLMFSKIHAASFKQHVFVSCINHRFEIPTRVSSGIISIPSLHNKARHRDQHPKFTSETWEPLERFALSNEDCSLLRWVKLWKNVMRHVWKGEMCRFFSFLWSVSGWVPRHRIHAPYQKVSQRKSNHSTTEIRHMKVKAKTHMKNGIWLKINIWESKIISNTSSGRMWCPKATRVSSKHFRHTLSHTQRWSGEIQSTNKLASSNIHCLPNKKTIEKAKLEKGCISESSFSVAKRTFEWDASQLIGPVNAQGVPRDPRPMQIAWHPPELPVLGLAVVLPSKHWRRCGPSRCWRFLISKIGFAFIVILLGN